MARKMAWRGEPHDSSEGTLTVEFKSDRKTIGDNVIIDEVVAFANTEGGDLFLGVEDDGRVTGVQEVHRDPIRMGSLEAFRLSAIRKAPFYACKLSGMVLATLDGIKINTKLQALDTDNKPIEGLYVIGNDSGNYYNGSYPNLAAGLNAGRCVTFGMLCGRQLARA